MPIEPEHVTTVSRRPVMPPKPHKSVLAPVMSMEADAKRCNARLQRVMGASRDGGPGLSANLKRMAEAEARQAELAGRVLDLLRQQACGELRHSQIKKMLNLTENQSRAVMTRLKLEGRAFYRKGPSGASIWRAVE